MITVPRTRPIGPVLINVRRSGGTDTTVRFRRIVEHRIAMSLRRFVRSIEGVDVWLVQGNGRQPGVDKGCRLRVRLVRSRPVTVAHFAANHYVAMVHAVRRAKGSVDRRLKRQRTQGRRWGALYRLRVTVDEVADYLHTN